MATKIAPSFPNFAGKVYRRPANYRQLVGANPTVDEYSIHAYQYATSSKPGYCEPAAIIYAANNADVKLTIQYAKDAGVAIALRTGGHQYGGFSSTSGDNIQLDMSGFRRMVYDETSKTVTCGVGVQLMVLDELFLRLGAFVPHGQCGTVCLGGHMQTGGFSVLCGRSFGWFCDYVTEFQLITADLETRIIRRPDPEQPELDNDEMWFAIIGGSPGNFGVVTQMVIKPLWDKEHPQARTSTIYMPYSKAAYEEMLQIIAEHNDNDELAADFNICAFILDEYQPVLRPNIDTKMMQEHPTIYGEGLEPHPAVIGIWATWCNLDGGEYTSEAKEFFSNIRARTRPHESRVYNAGLKLAASVFGKLMPLETPDAPVKMSALTNAFCFPKRVHANPYVSGTWCGQSQELSTNGFAKWASGITTEVLDQKGCYADFEWVVCGGKYSKNKTNTITNPTAISWRNVTLLSFLYIHYDNTTYLGRDWSEPRRFSEAWVPRARAGAIGPNGVLGERYQLWNAFPDEDAELDRDRAHYYRSQAVYERVLAVKRTLDPGDVFTPNLFCVGVAQKTD